MDDEAPENDTHEQVDDDLGKIAEEPDEENENQEQESDINAESGNGDNAENLSQTNDVTEDDGNQVDDEVELDVEAVDIEADEQELNPVDEASAELDEDSPDDDQPINEHDEPIEEADATPLESESDPAVAIASGPSEDSTHPEDEPPVELDQGNGKSDTAQIVSTSSGPVSQPIHVSEQEPIAAPATEPINESQITATSVKSDAPDPVNPAHPSIQPALQAAQAPAVTSSAVPMAAAAEATKSVPENVLTLRRMLREAMNEYSQLTMDGLKTQSRIATLKYSSGQATDLRYSVSDDIGELSRQYAQSLSRVTDLYNVFKTKQDTFNSKISRLNKLLDEEDENAAELKESFKQFRRELCKAAVFNRTGATFSMKKMEKLEAMEFEKDRELESLRLKHIHYRNQLKKQEEAVKQREQLSEGLHLIDFEQLKIENQTLNEKIEERNDDLHKLKKKVTTTVQVLTHIKEKIEFIELENESLKRELSTLDKELQEKRDHMAKAKRVRDRLRIQCQ